MQPQRQFKFNCCKCTNVIETKYPDLGLLHTTKNKRYIVFIINAVTLHSQFYGKPHTQICKIIYYYCRGKNFRGIARQFVGAQSRTLHKT